MNEKVNFLTVCLRQAKEPSYNRSNPPIRICTIPKNGLDHSAQFDLVVGNVNGIFDGISPFLGNNHDFIHG